jgi:hypothetical protein
MKVAGEHDFASPRAQVVANPLRYAFGRDATEAAMFARKAYASGRRGVLRADRL